MDNNIYKYFIVGSTEVMLTHPIEYIRTQYQYYKTINNIHFNSHKYINSLYPRILTVVPMRIVFWKSLNFHKLNNKSFLQTVFVTSKLQTILDFPSEQIKVRTILNHNISIRNCFTGNFLIHGYLYNYFRNYIFLFNLLGFTYQNNNFYNIILGTTLGIYFSHPFDNIKTIYQNDKQFLFKNIKLQFLFKGVSFRCINSIIAMLCGIKLFNFI